MQRRSFMQAASAATLGATGLGARSATASAGDRLVRLGQSASLTGWQGRYGRSIHAGVSAALAAANRQEGPRGLQFELIALDDGGVHQRCLDNTRRLIEGGASALVGFTSGAAAEACLGLVNQSQMALIGTASGNMGLRGKAQAGAVHVRAGHDVEYRRIVGYIQSCGFQRIGHVCLQDSSRADLDAMTDALDSVGLKPSVALAIDRNAISLLPVVQQLIAAKLDAVMFTTNAGPALTIIEQMTKAQFRGMYFASSLAGQDLIDGVAATGRSVVMSLVVPRPGALGIGVVSQCQQDLRALGGSATLSVTTLEGYIAGRVAVEAVRQAAHAGGTGRQRIRDTLAHLRTDLGGYRLNYAPDNLQGSQYVDLVVIDRYGRIAG